MITIEVNDSEIRAALGRLQQRAARLRPALAAIGGILRSEALSSFERQVSPEGRAWAPLTAAAIVARARRRAPAGFRKRRAATIRRFATGAKALLDTGALRASIGSQARGGLYQLTDNSVTVGTRLRYAAIHQFGGRAGRRKRVQIPARPFLGIGDTTRSRIVAVVLRHLESGDA